MTLSYGEETSAKFSHRSADTVLNSSALVDTAWPTAWLLLGIL